MDAAMHARMALTAVLRLGVCQTSAQFTMQVPFTGRVTSESSQQPCICDSTRDRECAQQAGPNLQLLKLAQVCAAPNLSQAEESQPAGGLVTALDCAEQCLDSVGGLVGSSSCAQYSNALGNVVLSCLADLAVMASSQKRC